MGRLGVEQIGLYQIHWPGFITNGFANDSFVQGLADCQKQGLTKVPSSALRTDRRADQAVGKN